MLTLVKRLVREDEGATMVEYGLMVALIAVFLIAIVINLSGKIGGTFNNAGNKL